MAFNVMAPVDDKSATLTRRRKVEEHDNAVDDDAKKKATRATEQALMKRLMKGKKEKRKATFLWNPDDLEFVLLASLSFGLVALLLAGAAGFAYIHFEGAGRPVVHAGDAPRYQACDRLSQVGRGERF
jgi:hypothetical protein